MEELIKALESLLERGITIEPIYVEHGGTSMRPAYRIRLTEEQEEVTNDATYVRGW